MSKQNSLRIERVNDLMKTVNKITVLATKDRSSLLDVFCKKGVLKNFAKFTGKHLFQSLFLNKVAGLSTNCNP